MTIGEKIRKARQQKSLTQNELAELSGVDAKTIHRIETGKVAPRLSTLRMISKILALNLNTEEMPDSGRSKAWLIALNLTNFYPIIVLPLLIWYFKKDEIDAVNDNGPSVINFQITYLLLTFILMLVTFIATQSFGGRINFQLIAYPIFVFQATFFTIIIYNFIRISKRNKLRYFIALRIIK